MRLLNRAQVGLFLVALLTIGSSAGHSDPSRGPAGPALGPPNVLIVVTDDQRLDTMESLKATGRRWVDRGRQMIHGYVTTPLCCPARTSIMTGQYVHNHGVTHNHATDNIDHEHTLQYYLSQAGYRTAIFGKYLNNYPHDPVYFDRWAVPDSDGNPHYFDEIWNVDGTSEVVAQYATDYIRDSAVAHLQSLESDDDRPWFTYVSPLAPHFPSPAAPRHNEREVTTFEGNPAVFETDKADKPRYVRKREPVPLKEGQKTASRQRRALLAVDDLVRRLDKTLNQLGELENTLVLFISDNGLNWGEHGLYGASTAKDTPYTPTVHIPIIMKWPGRVAAGTIEGRPATNVDIAPTIYDAVGLRSSIAHKLDGHSLLNASWTRSFVFLENFTSEGSVIPSWNSVLTENRQYIESYGKKGRVIFRELYDLEQDPWQLSNLLHDGRPNNDPNIDWFEAKLAAARTCAGTRGDNSCP